MSLPCTTIGCERQAERIVALKTTSTFCRFVAPYCEEHGVALVEQGYGDYAAGPALSEEASKIEGLRR